MNPRSASKHEASATEHPRASFDPKVDGKDAPDWLGKRQTIEVVPEIILWRWPKSQPARLQAFDDWHDIAMQVVHFAGGGFRLMAVYEKVIRWNEGCIWSSDEELSLAAGRCSWKTISREVAAHRKVGIIAIDHGWRHIEGKKLRTRTIRLAIPAVLDTRIVVRDLTNHMDTRGPSTNPNHMDTRGPKHTDTRGPITLVTREEGESRSDPAQPLQ